MHDDSKWILEVDGWTKASFSLYVLGYSLDWQSAFASLRFLPASDIQLLTCWRGKTICGEGTPASKEAQRLILSYCFFLRLMVYSLADALMDFLLLYPLNL